MTKTAFQASKVSSNIVFELFPMLVKNQEASIELDKDGRWHAKKLGWLAKAIHFNDPKYHDERIGRIAAVLSKALSEQPRLALKEVDKNLQAKAASKFLRGIRKQKHTDPRIAECRKQYLATKLGVHAQVFDANPGFQEYAKTSYLERYLMNYGHSLKIDKAAQQIEIQQDGSYKPWHKAYAQYQALPDCKGHPQQPWLYGPKGMQKQDMYNWKELKPFMYGNPADWGNQYIFEFCSCCSNKPRMNGDHAWIRLKTPAGEIYSVGLYRPGKSNWMDNYRNPFRVKEGYLMQPDVSEFWPTDIYTIPIAITKEQFLKMKSAIEEDKHNNDQVFQLFQKNCTLYCHKVAAIGNIKLPTSETTFRLIAPPKTQRKADQILDKLPSPLRRICLYTQAFFINLTQLILGAGKVDSKVAAKFPKKNVKPHIDSLTDIFKISKSELNHPFTLAQKTRKRILEWRQQETLKLKSEQGKLKELLAKQVPADKIKTEQKIIQLEKEIARVQYDLPPQFRIA